MNLGKNVCVWMVCMLVAAATADGKEDTDTDEGTKARLQQITLAGGSVTLALPAAWEAQPLRSRILEREFAVPAVKEEGSEEDEDKEDGDEVDEDEADEDEADGRLTMMRSGGSVTENVNRWIGQFTQTDGKPTEDRAKVRDKKINGQEVTIVEIAGTFKDRQGGGPFAPGRIVERPGYRMLGAIVQTRGQGQYFFKLYGPDKTILAAKKPFLAMLETMESK